VQATTIERLKDDALKEAREISDFMKKKLES
jgi:hypothetical protein